MDRDGYSEWISNEYGINIPKADGAHPQGEQRAAAAGEYAGIIIRFIASIVDGIVLGIIMVIVAVIIIIMLPVFVHPHSLDDSSALIVAFGVMSPLLVAMWLYYAGFESSRHMATPGKLLCGLKVTNTDFGRLTFLQATWRLILKSVPSVFRLGPGSACACLTLIFALGDVFAMYTNDQRQCVHDMLAGTYVVHER